MVAIALLSLVLQEEWQRLDVRLTTTSDWTQVEFPNALRFFVDDQTIETPAEHTAGALAIHKRSMDATQATLNAAVFVRFPQKGDLVLLVTRGSIGSTRVALSAGAETLLDAVHEGPTGGGRNPREFAVRRPKAAPVRLDFKKQFPKLALAFYYPWYGSPEGPSKNWVHWRAEGRHDSTDTPELGLYDSQDDQTIHRHIAWAKEAGIDAFISSWWGPGSFEDRALRRVLAVAEKEGFLVSAYLERPQDVADGIRYLRGIASQSRAFLKQNGKPVLFLYTRALSPKLLPDGAIVVADTFDVGTGRLAGGLHTYNPVFTPMPELLREYRQASFACSKNALVFGATVVPGYDDTVIRRPGARMPRDGGAFYDRSWETALAGEPDWLLICSFNEWHEGSEIEPSKEYGDLYLRKTAEWVRRWKK